MVAIAHEREGTARAADGVRLWWRAIDAPGNRAVPLVLSNGAACSVHYWPLLVEHFAGRVPLILWDYRGHGRSARAPRETYDIPFFARDLLAVLDALEVDRAALVGHSMGVQVVLDAWRQAPARVAALVAMFGAHGEILQGAPDGPLLRTVEAALAGFERLSPAIARTLWPALGTPPAILAARLLGSNPTLCPPRYLHELMAHVKTVEPALVARVFRAVLRYDATRFLGEIDAPTLIFAGEVDRLTPVGLAERMARAIRHAELAIVDHGSHLAMLENPGFVHCRLELFLRDYRLFRP